MPIQIPFSNRETAGEEVAKLLPEFSNSEAIVVALPRGGVVTAKAVSRALRLPLEIVVVKKIGHPFNPEYALGAITEKGFTALNEKELQNIPPDWFTEEKEKKLAEAVHKRDILWDDRQILPLRDQVVIIVDDGIATGYTLLAAIQHVKAQNPKKIIVAVPVAPRDSLELVRTKVDEVRVAHIPENFIGAVGSYYREFEEVTDSQAKKILQNPNDPLIFFMQGMDAFANEILARGSQLQTDFHRGEYRCLAYSNQELRIELQSDVHAKDVVYIGSVTPPHERVMETFLFCHTCKKERAEKITLVLPYMAYTRHDHDKPKEDQALALIADIAQSAGISDLITIDAHSRSFSESFAFPAKSIDPWSLLARALQKEQIIPDIFVAPDEGAERRAVSLKSALSSTAGIVVFHKERTMQEVKSVVKSGVIRGSTAVLVDDILDTGKTLELALKELRARGIQRSIIVVSHAVCSSADWMRLFSLGVELIITTDSVLGSPAFSHPQCRVVSVAGILADEVVSHA